MDFSLLQNREIIDILIGDSPVYLDYKFPYMSGPNLCELSTKYGLVKSYSWGGGGNSRWVYMVELLQFLNISD